MVLAIGVGVQLRANTRCGCGDQPKLSAAKEKFTLPVFVSDRDLKLNGSAAGGKGKTHAAEWFAPRAISSWPGAVQLPVTAHPGFFAARPTQVGTVELRI